MRVSAFQGVATFLALIAATAWPSAAGAAGEALCLGGMKDALVQGHFTGPLVCSSEASFVLVGTPAPRCTPSMIIAIDTRLPVGMLCMAGSELWFSEVMRNSANIRWRRPHTQPLRLGNLAWCSARKAQTQLLLIFQRVRRLASTSAGIRKVSFGDSGARSTHCGRSRAAA